jgi:hypothetical protein
MVAGCGTVSRLPGLGWFGSNTVDPVTEARAILEEPLVDQVVSIEVAPTPTGAIVSAVGLPPTQGYWDADLVEVPTQEAGTLLLEFRLLPPIEPARVGTQPSREVLAGTMISDQDLAGIRTIRVQAARNAAASRR